LLGCDRTTARSTSILLLRPERAIRSQTGLPRDPAEEAALVAQGSTPLKWDMLTKEWSRTKRAPKTRGLPALPGIGARLI
jgi:hypothetical protein